MEQDLQLFIDNALAVHASAANGWLNDWRPTRSSGSTLQAPAAADGAPEAPAVKAR